MINQIRPTTSNNPNVYTPFIDKDGVNYAISKPFNEDSIMESKKHKERKSNALGVSIAVTSLVAGFGVLALMKGLPNGARLKVDKLFNYLEKKVSTLKKNDHLTAVQKFYIASLEKMKSLTNKSKGIFNAGAIKDATFKAGIDKVPFLKKFDNKITKLFETISVRTSRNSYAKTMSKFDDLYATFSEANSKLNPKQKTRINQLINNAKATYQEGFTSTPRRQRLSTTKTDLSGLHEKVRDRIFNVKTFVKDKETYTTFIPEELAANAKTKLLSSVTPHKEKMTKDMDEILNIYKDALPEKEFLKIQKQTKASMNSLDKSINIETDKLFDKLRDLEIGSAPTDILSVVTALGVIGWGLNKADNKDERTSVALKYGIPAMGAILTSLYCTVGLISGGTSLIFGLVSGAVISKAGEVIDKSRKDYKEKPITLPSFGLIKKAPDAPKQVAT